MEIDLKIKKTIESNKILIKKAVIDGQSYDIEIRGIRQDEKPSKWQGIEISFLKDFGEMEKLSCFEIIINKKGLAISRLHRRLGHDHDDTEKLIFSTEELSPIELEHPLTLNIVENA